MKLRAVEDEREFLASDKPEAYPRPSVAVELVVLTIIDAQLRVLLTKRQEQPFKNAWGLPGGVLRVGQTEQSQGEDLDVAAQRELQAVTGLSSDRVFLEQLYTFGKAGRDPRTRVISVAYYALVRPDLAPMIRAGVEGSHAEWFVVEGLKRVDHAFDHREVVQTALERLRGKIEYSNLAFDLVPQTFTVPELRTVFEIVLGKAQDPGNFRRGFARKLSDGLIEKAPGKRITTSKPATVYRLSRS